MAEDNPILRMGLDELRQVVADLEDKYRAWTPARLDAARVGTVPKVTLEDLARIRASLQRSIAHLDRLLVDWDQAHGRY